jgi:hypothetical protein
MNRTPHIISQNKLKKSGVLGIGAKHSGFVPQFSGHIFLFNVFLIFWAYLPLSANLPNLHTNPTLLVILRENGGGRRIVGIYPLLLEDQCVEL